MLIFALVVVGMLRIGLGISGRCVASVDCVSDGFWAGELVVLAGGLVSLFNVVIGVLLIVLVDGWRSRFRSCMISEGYGRSGLNDQLKL